MKKYLSGLTAVLLAVVLASFSTANSAEKRALDTLYWYQTNSGTGSQSSFVDADVSYTGTFSDTPPSTCDATNTYKCIIGFTASQVNTSTFHLVSGSQTPASTGRWRATQ